MNGLVLIVFVFMGKEVFFLFCFMIVLVFGNVMMKFSDKVVEM